MISSLRELLAHVSARRRRQLWPILGLMLLGAAAEVVSLGAIIPFLAVLARPEVMASNELAQRIFRTIGAQSPNEVVVITALFFAFSAVVAAAVRLLLVWGSQKFVFGIAQELSIAVYRRTLYQPYAYHTAHNSSETLSGINKAQMLATGLLVPLMQGAAAATISICIVTSLFFVDPVVAGCSFAGFALIYIGVMRFTREMVRRNGAEIARAHKQRIQATSEGLGGIRDVLLGHSQPVFIKRFSEVEAILRRAQASTSFVSASPRFVVESLGLVLIAALALTLSLREGGLLGAIPVLGALAMGAQRLLPLLQQLYIGWTASVSSWQVLQDVLDILNLPDAPQFSAPTDVSAVPLNRSITLDRVSFMYPERSRPAVRDVCVTIPKGARVGLVGKTGSGKSTIMDLLLGLLTPSSGRILIDDTELTDQNRSAWQARIAHVPQSIYLSDGSVAENIAFGVPSAQIDLDRVREAARQAELDDVIESMPQGYENLVGERGIRLSGGQRQRIGIARALYKQAELLVFDEATSALDAATESEIMNTLDRIGTRVTMVIIAHRSTALRSCDFIVSVHDGSVRKVEKQVDLLTARNH